MTSPTLPAGHSGDAADSGRPSRRFHALSAWFDGSYAMRAIVYGLVAATVIVTVLALLGIKLDLTIASLFYDPTTQRFWDVSNRYVLMVREHGLVAVYTCVACILLGLMSLLPWRVPSIRIRSAAALTAAILLGPGLLVNALLKPYWGRPRPLEVLSFGGTLPYVDWWNPAGACPSNCSFMSGEASMAAWLFGPALLMPPPWRGIAIAVAAAFTIAVSLGRMATGSHFFSDIIIGVLTTILILLAMRRLIDPPPAVHTRRGTTPR